MHFTTDSQTLEDLNIFGKPGRDSVYALFNKTYTRGGAQLLEDFFRYPLSDAAAINKRIGIMQYFATKNFAFPFKQELFDIIELYLSNTDQRTRLTKTEQSLGQKLTDLVSKDSEYKNIVKGVESVIELLKELNAFRDLMNSSLNASSSYHEELATMIKLLEDPGLKSLNSSKANKLQFEEIAALDRLIRFQENNNIRMLLSLVYKLDVYISIAKVSLERGYTFPEVLPKEQHQVILDGVYHPHVKGAVANYLTIAPQSNVIFLTGANMAGKSTLMKSLGVAMFLAHMGFPVPAKKMSFSPREGIYTTINLPDNLSMGASHFYAEVLRIKKIARELGQSKNLFIIFDELFRGTNVKDAYEATVAITSAFARKRNCMFIVSTHIMEAGEELGQRCPNIKFVFLPTKMQGSVPKYTYTLEDGITEDRHGMIIINNEGILDLLRNPQTASS